MSKPRRSWPRALGVAKPTTERTGGISRKTLAALAAVVTLLAAVAVVTALAATSPTSGSAARDSQIDKEVDALLAGIPQAGNTLGRPNAPVTLQVFGDLECNDVQHWVLRLLPAIIRKYVRPGILKIQYRSFRTDTLIRPVFVNQQQAALAAGAQDKLWNFIEIFYHEQGPEYTPYVTERYLDAIATQVPGLDLTHWHTERVIGRFAARVVSDDRTARTEGFHDTPAFMIGHTGGRLRKLVGREIIKYFHQPNPVSLINVEDLHKAINELHLPPTA